MKINAMEDIHNNLINGNRSDCVKQIKKYGLYDFWSDYRSHLENQYDSDTIRLGYFQDMTISYFRITNR